MVHSLMYCAEQIIVPEQFPDMLKTYAKAVIRTQPYDLLRWSAAYFRCLAIGLPPPVKPRLEPEVSFGSVTKGYLRTLIDQLGKGYFVSREVLQSSWEGLCLPENELLKYLSLCRMLHWSQIHWLKFIAVLVGAMNQDIRDTVVMLCEVLTEEPEGGPSPIPMWMFRECYTFIAELDCSQQQNFMNGRKVLDNGELEDEVIMPGAPRVLSSLSFRDIILDEWKNRTTCNTVRDLNRCTEINEVLPDSPSSNVSRVSSSFKFIGDFSDPYQVIRRSPDFDSIILLLHEMQGDALHKYDGPAHITEKNIEHAKKRERELLEKREQMAVFAEEEGKKYLHHEQVEMLREMGPPWSWMHQFTSQNCRDKSYNFIEQESIASDETPPDSSDESFDFDQEKYISPGESEVKLPIDEPLDELEKILFCTEQNPCSDEDDGESDTKKLPENVLKEVAEVLTEAQSEGKIDISNTSSIVSFLRKDEICVLHRASKKARVINYAPLRKFLKEAEEQGIVFHDIEELLQYFKDHCDRGADLYANELEEIIYEPEDPIHMAERIPVDDKEITEECEIPLTDIREYLPEGEFFPEDKPSDAVQPKPAPTPSAKSSAHDRPTTPELSIEVAFDDSNIEVDEKIRAKEIPEPMILGLVDVPPRPEEEEEQSLEEQSHITTTATTAIDSYSDISSKPYSSCEFSEDGVPTIPKDHIEVCSPLDEQEEEIEAETEEEPCNLLNRKEKLKGSGGAKKKTKRRDCEEHPEPPNCEPEPIPEEPFNCIIPPLPGIGKPIPEKIIKDFLTYLKFRSREDKGMVYPRHFKEDNCPSMTDCVTGF